MNEKTINEELQRQGLPTRPQKKTNHILHLLLSLVTLGVWVPVWIQINDSNKEHNADAVDIAKNGPKTLFCKAAGLIVKAFFWTFTLSSSLIIFFAVWWAYAFLMMTKG